MLLSVILVSYNSHQVLTKCLEYLRARLKENFSAKQTEIIIVDNNSKDGTKKWLSKQSGLRTVFLPENIGFGRANNTGLSLAKGEFVLLLNTDVYLNEKVNFVELLEFLNQDQKAAGLTIKLLLKNGQIDPASHRGFPTPFNAFTYFSGLETLFAKIPGFNRIFGGYHLSHQNLKSIHRIDSPTAAFYLLKKKILNHLNGFDPDYFFYAEDLDLSYRIKNLGYAIWYYPKYSALHLKSQSGKKSGNQAIRKQTQAYFYQTMLTFYQKHYSKKYPTPINYLVKLGIKLKSLSA